MSTRPVVTRRRRRVAAACSLLFLSSTSSLRFHPFPPSPELASPAALTHGRLAHRTGRPAAGVYKILRCTCTWLRPCAAVFIIVCRRKQFWVDASPYAGFYFWGGFCYVRRRVRTLSRTDSLPFSLSARYDRRARQPFLLS